MAATTAHASAHALLRHAVSRGVPRGVVEGWLGVRAADLARPGRLPASRVATAWVALRDTLADAAVGVRATRAWSLADHGLYGFIVAAAPTVRAGLAAAARGARLVTERGAWRIVEARDVARCAWTWHGPLTADHALANEVMVTAFARGVRELSGAPPLRVELVHRAPTTRAVYEELLGSDVRFDRPANVVVVDRARLELAPPGANPALHAFLGELSAQQLAALAAPTAGERSAQLLAAALREGAALPGLREAARNLGMSERSLRRRLAAEGRGFRELRGAAQLERAAELLERSAASLAEIAAECGFADASALGRAWRRRHGEAPSRSRRITAR